MSKRKKPTGDCYEAAATLLMQLCEYDGSNVEASQNVRLVHAEVAGQGKLSGLTFGHAFVLFLDTETVLDPSNGGCVLMSKTEYFRLGRIDEIGNVQIYDIHQAARQMVEFEHYGPWDLVTATGL